MRTSALTTGALTACLLCIGSAAHAAEIRVLASNGMKAAIEALSPQFKKPGGDTLSIDFSTAATLKERIDKGEPFDVAILTDDVMDALIASRGLTSSTRVRLARVGMGIGFRRGAAKPDVRTTAAIKKALLDAKSIAFASTGASRPYIDRMFASLGIEREMQAKTHLTGAGLGPASVATGDSEIVITLISEILPVDNVVLAGPLPPDFQSYLGFSAAVGARSGHALAAQRFIELLHGPAAAATYASKGMEPFPRQRP